MQCKVKINKGKHKMNTKFMIKTVVVSVSLALTACGSGGGGGTSGSGLNTGSTETGGQFPGTGGTGSNGTGTGGENNPTTPTTTPTIPMPSENPAANDSNEAAPAPDPVTNTFDNNNFNQPNDQANRLNLKTAYDQNLSGAGVKVGVIDGAMNTHHPALSNIRVVDHGSFTTDSNPGTAHATGVGLVIAGQDVNGNVYGIAKDVELHAADVSHRDGAISLNAAVRAMYEMYNNGVRIINNSYGFDSLETYKDYAREYLAAADSQQRAATQIGQIKNLIDHGALLIFSAGNSGKNQPSGEVLFPLVEPELQKGLISIVGTTPNGSIDPQSNKCGDTKNWCIAAPFRVYTSNLEATDEATLNRYASSMNSGTSFSAPQVTAAAALVQQKYPWMSNDNLRTTLLTTATDLGAKGVDSVYGWGLLNIGKAVNGPAQFAFGNFTADIDSGSYSFTNNLAGSGGLIKTGNGELILTGTNTYTGMTNINGGTLSLTGSSVSSANIGLHGKYRVSGSTGSVTNMGTFVSEDAVINGDYTQTFTGTLETKIGSVTRVSGTAMLGGTLSLTGFKSGYTADNTTVDILTADKRIGEFQNTTVTPGLLLSSSTQYTPTAVQLNFTRNSARAAAARLDSADSAVHVGAANIDAAFDRLEAAPSSGNDRRSSLQSVQLGAAQLQSITDPAVLSRSAYSLAGTVYSNATTVNSLEQGRLGRDLLDTLDTDQAGAQAVVKYHHHGGSWQPEGSEGKQSTNTGLVGVVENFGDITLSGAYAFHHTDWTEKQNSSSRDTAKISSNGIIVGAKYQPDSWRGVFVEGNLGYSRYKNDVSRTVWLNEQAYRTGAQVNGNAWQIAAATGKAWHWSGFTLLPSVGVRYEYLSQNGFTEPSASGYGLRADAINKGLFVGTADLAARYLFNLGSVPADMYANIGYEHDFRNRSLTVSGSLNGVGSPAESGSWVMPRNRWSVGAGGSVRLSPAVILGIGYRYQGNGHYRNNEASAHLKVAF